MLITIILYVVAGAAIGSAIGSNMYVLAVLIVAAVIYSCKARWDKANAIQPSAMVCPNCGSDFVRIENRVEGVSGNSSAHIHRSVIAPKHFKTVNRQHKSQLDRQRVGVCQLCGFDYPYVTAQEAEKARNEARAVTIIGMVVAAVFALFGLAA